MIKTKIALVAALIAAFATPSFARDGQINYARHQGPHATLYMTAPVIEGRNSAVTGSFWANGQPSGRDALVESLGN
jgi:hypothetical protein